MNKNYRFAKTSVADPILIGIVSIITLLGCAHTASATNGTDVTTSSPSMAPRCSINVFADGLNPLEGTKNFFTQSTLDQDKLTATFSVTILPNPDVVTQVLTGAKPNVHVDQLGLIHPGISFFAHDPVNSFWCTKTANLTTVNVTMALADCEKKEFPAEDGLSARSDYRCALFVTSFTPVTPHDFLRAKFHVEEKVITLTIFDDAPVLPPTIVVQSVCSTHHPLSSCSVEGTRGVILEAVQVLTNTGCFDRCSPHALAADGIARFSCLQKENHNVPRGSTIEATLRLTFAPKFPQTNESCTRDASCLTVHGVIRVRFYPPLEAVKHFNQVTVISQAVAQERQFVSPTQRIYLTFIAYYAQLKRLLWVNVTNADNGLTRNVMTNAAFDWKCGADQVSGADDDLSVVPPPALASSIASDRLDCSFILGALWNDHNERFTFYHVGPMQTSFAAETSPLYLYNSITSPPRTKGDGVSQPEGNVTVVNSTNMNTTAPFTSVNGTAPPSGGGGGGGQAGTTPAPATSTPATTDAPVTTTASPTNLPEGPSIITSAGLPGYAWVLVCAAAAAFI